MARRQSFILSDAEKNHISPSDPSPKPDSPENLEASKRDSSIELSGSNFEDEVEMVSEDEVDVLDEDQVDREFIIHEELYYSTGDIARQLGISRDMTRKHIKDFEDYIHTKANDTGKGAHMRILSTDFPLIQRIVRFRKNGYSVEEVKKLLDDPEMNPLMSSNQTFSLQEQFAELLSKQSTLLLSEIKKMQDGVGMQNQLLLEENNQKNQQLTELRHEIYNLTSVIKNQDELIKKQGEVLDSVSKILEEQNNSPKKKGLFGFLK